MQDMIVFHKGLAYDKWEGLQQAGYLSTAENILLDTDFKTVLRPSFMTLNGIPVGDIHSIKKFKNLLVCGYETTLCFKDYAIGEFTTVCSTMSGDPLYFSEYKDNLYITDKKNSFLMDADGNTYNAIIDDPATAPVGTDSGVAGSPSDTYSLYVSFLITFPNGTLYETGLSEGSGDVTVVAKQIAVSALPVSSYKAIYGVEPTIHRKYYRGPGSGGSIANLYLVTTIDDNTTLTYTDNETTTQIEANGTCYVNTYQKLPQMYYQTFHFGRLHGLDVDKPHRWLYTEAATGNTADENEALLPLAYSADSWDDIRTLGLGQIDPQGVVAWGPYIYIPLRQTWIKKSGTDPDRWILKKMWASYGISAPMSLAVMQNPTGIMGFSLNRAGNAGLTLFDGDQSQLITSPKFDYFFTSNVNLKTANISYGAWDGKRYHFLHPSVESTTNDTWSVFDLTYQSKGDVRLANWTDLKAHSMDVDDQGTRIYLGCSDGYVRTNVSGEKINVHIRTHPYRGTFADSTGNLTVKKKTYQNIRYALNTGGEDVIIRIYVDDVLMGWHDGTTEKIINSTDSLFRSFEDGLPSGVSGYSIAVELVGSGLSTFELYGPWVVDSEYTD